jgi:hypothetical protein
MLIEVVVEALLGTVPYPLTALASDVRTLFACNICSTRWTPRGIMFAFSMMLLCPMPFLALVTAICWDFASHASILHFAVDHYA